MVQSGVKASDEAKEVYNEIRKSNSKAKKFSGAVFKFNADYSVIVVEKTFDGNTANPYNAVMKELHDGECRLAAVLLQYVEKTGSAMKISDKMLVIKWAPDTSKIKPKMTMAASWNALKREFDAGEYLELGEEADKLPNALLDKFKLTGTVETFDGRPVKLEGGEYKYQ